MSKQTRTNQRINIDINKCEKSSHEQLYREQNLGLLPLENARSGSFMTLRPRSASRIREALSLFISPHVPIFNQCFLICYEVTQKKRMARPTSASSNQSHFNSKSASNCFTQLHDSQSLLNPKTNHQTNSQPRMINGSTSQTIHESVTPQFSQAT